MPAAVVVALGLPMLPLPQRMPLKSSPRPISIQVVAVLPLLRTFLVGGEAMVRALPCHLGALLGAAGVVVPLRRVDLEMMGVTLDWATTTAAAAAAHLPLQEVVPGVGPVRMEIMLPRPLLRLPPPPPPA